MKNAAFVCLCLLSFHFSATAATPHYFVTRLAGAATPLSNPIALKQPPSANAIAYDYKGNLYYTLGRQILRLNPDGTDTPIVGSPSSSARFVEGEPAIDAPVEPYYFSFDNTGNLYIADGFSNVIYKVTPDGAIRTFAGNGASPSTSSLPITGPNVPGTSVPISFFGLAVDSSGNVYVQSDVNSGSGSPTALCSVILSFPPDGSSSSVVATISGGQCIFNSPSLVVAGSELIVGNGTAGQSYEIALPGGPSQQAAPIHVYLGDVLAVDPNGSIDFLGSSGIEQVNPQTFQMQTLPNSSAVSGSSMAVNPVTGDVAVNSRGVVNVWTALNGKYQPVCCNAPTFSGDGGPATLAAMSPQNMAADPSGNLFFVDQRRIRKITPAGVVNTIAGTGVAGYTGDSGSALLAEIAPGEMAADGVGNLYFINNDGTDPITIRKIDGNGNIATVLGGGNGKLVNGASPTSLSFTGAHMAVDTAGDIFFNQNAQIWELNTSGTITLLAGTGFNGTVTNGTPALSANVTQVSSIAVSKSGTVYFADDENQVIFEIDAQGNLQILAGEYILIARVPKSIPPGPATGVNIGDPEFLQVEGEGNLYFYGDIFGSPNEILRVDTSGNLTVVTGLGSGGEGGDAANGSFYVAGFAMDASGAIYISNGTYIERLSPYDPNSPPPFVSAGGVVGAGGSLPAVAAVSPGGEVSIFGGNFVAAANAHTVTNADLVDGKIPTTLAGVCASFGGAPAAMLGVYPGQLNVQVGALAPGAVNVQVTANCGTPQAVTSNYSGVVVQAASPEFYSFKPDPIGGQNPIAAVNALTEAFIGPPGLLSGATFVAAKAGDIVQAYATGFGATSPAYGLGVIPGAAGTLTNPYSLTLGGMPIPTANIAYAGISPCCAGFYQLDFTVPQGIPSGAQPLIMTVAGAGSPPLAYIQIGP